MRTAGERLLLSRLALLGVLLVFVVLVSSAYLRLVQGGVGCADWPACYGVERIAQAQRPAAAPPVIRWVRISHRFAAIAVTVVVIAVAVIALRSPRHRLVAAAAFALVALTVFLAGLGVVTPYSTLPAVTLGNVVGGLAMLALFWWLRLAASDFTPMPVRLAAWAWAGGMALLAIQIALGALVNANFASRACPDLPGCDGSAWLWDYAAFNPWREVDLPPVADAARRTLNTAHRAAGVLVAVFWTGLALVVARGGGAQRRRAGVLVLLIAVEIGLGLALVAFDLPRAIALAHHAAASLLLAAALSVVFRPQYPRDAQ